MYKKQPAVQEVYRVDGCRQRLGRNELAKCGGNCDGCGHSETEHKRRLDLISKTGLRTDRYGKQFLYVGRD